MTSIYFPLNEPALSSEAVFARLLATTSEHRHRDNKTISKLAAGRRGFRQPEHDVEACRVALGDPFPIDAPHNDRVRILYVLAWLSGFTPDPECSLLKAGRADLVISDGATPVAVIEVKSGVASSVAVSQVVRYRSAIPTAKAFVVAPRWTKPAIALAQAEDATLTTGGAVIHFLENLAGAARLAVTA